MKSYGKQNFFDLIPAKARQLIMDVQNAALTDRQTDNALRRVQVL